MTIREHEGQTHWSCSSSEQLRSKREIERLRMWSRQDLSGLLRLLDATSDSDNRGPASSERIRAGSSDAIMVVKRVLKLLFVSAPQAVLTAGSGVQ